MCGVIQKISSCICGAAELCLLPPSIIKKHSYVDVASTLEVNHVKTRVLCDQFHVIVFAYYIYHSVHDFAYRLNV